MRKDTECSPDSKENRMNENFYFSKEILGPNLPFTIPVTRVIFFWGKLDFIYLNNGIK